MYSLWVNVFVLFVSVKHRSDAIDLCAVKKKTHFYTEATVMMTTMYVKLCMKHVCESISNYVVMEHTQTE